MAAAPTDRKPHPGLVAIWLVVALTVLARLTLDEWSGDVEQVPLLLAAGLGAWFGARARTGREALGWRLVGAAWLISALAALLWFVSRVGPSSALEPIGTVLWNVYYPLMVVGLLLMVSLPTSGAARAGAVVDALTVSVACAVLVYFFIGRKPEATLVTLVTNALGETAVLASAAVLLSNERLEAPHRLLGAGALLASFSDITGAAAQAGSFEASAATIYLVLSGGLIGAAGLVRPGLRLPLRAPFEVMIRGLGHLPSGATLAVLWVVLDAASEGSSRTLSVLAAGAACVVALLLVSLALAHFSAEREADERAQQTERLAAAQRYMAFGQLAAAAVHDLNNMIVVLYGVASELRQRQPVPPEVEDLEAATRRAADICMEMLAMGRAPDTSGKCDLRAVVQGLESLLRRLVSSSLTLEVLTPMEPVPVIASRAHLEMALVNLVSNARDATKRGTITVSVETRSVTADDRYGSQGVPPGRWACLEVRDTGSGMSKELMEKVFKAFFTTKGAKGTGLGLAQVSDFAQQAGGRTVIDSREGEGTTVSVLLRLA